VQYKITLMHLFSAPEIFITDTYGMKTGAKNRCQKMESIYDTGFWKVCHGYYCTHHTIKVAKEKCVP